MSRLRRHREAAGLTQQQLADRAGVSRQLVGTVETGRHAPRVDAALALAHALDTDVDTLFGRGESREAVDIVTGGAPSPGLVRLAMVGDLVVTTPARITPAGFESADAEVGSDGMTPNRVRAAEGFVVAGCEPGLLALEQLLRERAIVAVAAMTSSATARAALEARRVHAAVVHGSTSWSPLRPPEGVTAYRLGQWRVGVCAPADSPSDWWELALEGRTPVIQREEGAGVQRSFVARAGRTDGPVVGSHVEAAMRSLATGMPAVTIEPAALALGAAFHAFDAHLSELWVSTDALERPAVRVALELLADDRLLHRLRGIGGYDLAQWGDRVA